MTLWNSVGRSMVQPGGMLITRRQIVVSLVAGAAGAALGWSHLICPTGECVMTGSWYGTGAIGAVFGFLYAEGCPACRLGERFSGPSSSDREGPSGPSGSPVDPSATSHLGNDESAPS